MEDLPKESVEVVEAAAAHAEAVETSRKIQIEAAVQDNKEAMVIAFSKAMRDLLTEGDEGTKALLIKKIPLLCTDILTIKSDIRWIKWIGSGIVGGIGLLALKSLGV